MMLMAVAELQPGQWDFQGMDPLVHDFLHATAGHSSVITISTMPAWFFRDDTSGSVAAPMDTEVWTYGNGSDLKDPTGQEAAE